MIGDFNYWFWNCWRWLVINLKRDKTWKHFLVESRVSLWADIWTPAQVQEWAAWTIPTEMLDVEIVSDWFCNSNYLAEADVPSPIIIHSLCFLQSMFANITLITNYINCKLHKPEIYESIRCSLMASNWFTVSSSSLRFAEVCFSSESESLWNDSLF